MVVAAVVLPALDWSGRVRIGPQGSTGQSWDAGSARADGSERGCGTDRADRRDGSNGAGRANRPDGAGTQRGHRVLRDRLAQRVRQGLTGFTGQQGAQGPQGVQGRAGFYWPDWSAGPGRPDGTDKGDRGGLPTGATGATLGAARSASGCLVQLTKSSFPVLPVEAHGAAVRPRILRSNCTTAEGRLERQFFGRRRAVSSR